MRTLASVDSAASKLFTQLAAQPQALSQPEQLRMLQAITHISSFRAAQTDAVNRMLDNLDLDAPDIDAVQAELEAQFAAASPTPEHALQVAEFEQALQQAFADARELLTRV